MASHSTISPQEAADRLAIRELIDAYAHCADRRDAKGQMALFTEATRFLVFMDARAAEPTQELHGRESLAPVFDNLNTTPGRASLAALGAGLCLLAGLCLRA